MATRQSVLACVFLAACGSGDSAGPDAATEDSGGVADAGDADGARPDALPFSITVAVVSDLNSSYGSTTYNSDVHAAVARIISVTPDLVLSAGDMVAGQQAGLDYEAMWDGFHAAVSDPLDAAGLPFAVTPGNHDASAYSGYAEEREVYETEWQARRPEVDFIDGTDYPFRYSFAVGAARFISIDDTKVGSLSDEQMTWLSAQLADSEAYAATIVFGHVPLYPIGQDRPTEIIGDPDLELLLVEGGADLLINGHVHAFYPGRRESGLRMLSMACLGSGPNPLLGDDTVSARSFVLIEINASGITSLDAFTGDAFDEPIARGSLPESVGTGEQTVIRDDL